MVGGFPANVGGDHAAGPEEGLNRGQHESVGTGAHEVHLEAVGLPLLVGGLASATPDWELQGTRDHQAFRLHREGHELLECFHGKRIVGAGSLNSALR